MSRTHYRLIVLLLAALLLPHAGFGRVHPAVAQTSTADRLLSPGFWIARLADPDRILIDDSAIAARNLALLHSDPSMHDLAAIPASLDGATVSHWLALSHRPSVSLFDAHGQAIPDAMLDALLRNADVAGVPASQPTRFGLAVRRAALRTFPTDIRVLTSIGDTDLDRFQESALFPGTPVVIAHRSLDGCWLFVVSARYAAWVDASAIAEARRDEVLAYADRHEARVVTGAAVRTGISPEAPRVSDMPLDMGLRLPIASAARDAVVNGQQAGPAWAVVLPTRGPEGGLDLQTALIARSADTRPAPLGATRANVIRQAFKFLGERYGWGEDYGTRDCSGFVSAIFASMGIQMPRNTGDQARSRVFKRLHPSDATERASIIGRLRPGDLVYIPGHVMLVIGQLGGEPYVIHDIHDGKVLASNGELRSLHLNGVNVTPLRALQLDGTHRFVDAITDVVSPLEPSGPRP